MVPDVLVEQIVEERGHDRKEEREHDRKKKWDVLPASMMTRMLTGEKRKRHSLHRLYWEIQ